MAGQHGGIDPNVVEAAALAHDLGHPPFGHVAEKELNELLLGQGDIGGYEGNAQSFRILTKLAVRRSASLGLNLTRATLNAALKYPWLQESDGNGGQRHKKWGAYQTEHEDFWFARAGYDGQDTTKCLECQIMDWADDIAYSIHDTEDFYRAGLIPLGHLSRDETAVGNFLESVFARWDQKNIPSEHSRSDLVETFEKLCQGLPFAGVYEPTRQQRAQLRGFTSNFIGRYIISTRIRESPDAQGHLLEIDREVLMQVTMLKELTWQFVIKGPSLAAVQNGQKQALRFLFQVFSEAVLSGDQQGRWGVLPARNRDDMVCLRQKYGAHIPQQESIRVAADAIAGMTDQQAMLMYHRLIGTSVGSVLDAIVI